MRHPDTYYLSARAVLRRVALEMSQRETTLHKLLAKVRYIFAGLYLFVASTIKMISHREIVGKCRRFLSLATSLATEFTRVIGSQRETVCGYLLATSRHNAL